MSWRKQLRDAARRRWRHKPGPVPWIRAIPTRLTLRFLRLLPSSWCLAIGDRLGRLAWKSERRRKLGRAQLAQALPDLSPAEADRILRDSCGHLGRSAIETLIIAPRQRKIGPGEWFEYEPGARETLLAVRGQGAVLVEAHFGGFEPFGGAISDLGLEPGFTMRPPSNFYVAKDLVGAREGWGIELFPRHGAVRRMLGHMKRGGAVILATDQDAHHAPIFVPWFGKLAATERAASAIALRMGSPVVACWAVRQPGVMRFRLGCKLIRPQSDPVPVSEEASVELSRQIHEALEPVIRQHPEQYLWIHNRYKTRPSEE